MKKTEIFQLVFIVLGITLMISVLNTLINTLPIINSQYEPGIYDVLPFFISALLFGAIGYFLIYKSSFFAKKIIKPAYDTQVDLRMPKYELLQLTILMISLVFLVKLFIPFFSAIAQISQLFIHDYTYLKNVFPDLVGTLLLYFFVIIIFLNTNPLAHWMDRKFFRHQ